MEVALVFCAVLVGLVTWYYFRTQDYYKHLKKFPGPRRYPLVGNTLDFIGKRDFIPTFMEYQQKYGGIIRWEGAVGRTMLLITDYKFMEFVLGSTKIIDKAKNYKFLNRWLGTGLLTSAGSKWKTHRKIITPAFHFQILEQYIEVFDSTCDILIEKLQKEVGKASVDIYPYITRCSLDIICETAMGTSVDSQSNPESGYFVSVREMCRIILHRSMSPLKQFNFLYYLTKDFQKELKCLEILHGYTKSVIKRRKKEHENSENIHSLKDDCGVKRKLNFLDILLKAKIDGQELSDDAIREEVDTFMFEGHDTVSSALSFTLYCLATHPEVQKKVCEEINSIFGIGTLIFPTYRDLQAMKYLEAVIKETLRLYPSVPFYARHIYEDIEYDDGILPKGLAIGVFAYGIHRVPEIFPNPERFDPERFASENSQGGSSPYCYIPFSAGPRNCIGQKFAMLEIKATVSKILKNFELLPASPVHELMLTAETVLKSANGVCISFKNRCY